MALNNIAIIGAGTMGGGIAIGCMAAGLSTCVIDLNKDSLATVQARRAKFFNRMVEKEKITQEQADDAQRKLMVSNELSAVSQADLVIEAIFENLEIKRDLFTRITPDLRSEAIVATNTSALRVADLATALPAPERFVGLHYFSPAEVNPLVELIAGPATSHAVIAEAAAFLATTGKTALPCQDANGFAVNRFFCPYTNEAVRIVDEQLATPGQVDRIACETFELAIGPFSVMNIVKPRINLNAVQNLSGLGAFYAPAAGLIEVGQAEGSFEIEESPAELDDTAAHAITTRLRAALFLPVLEAIGEGVAAPDDFDLGARLALRFGHPPVTAMRALGRDQVEEMVSALAQQYGADLPESGLEKVFA